MAMSTKQANSVEIGGVSIRPLILNGQPALTLESMAVVHGFAENFVCSAFEEIREHLLGSFFVQQPTFFVMSAEAARRKFPGEFSGRTKEVILLTVYGCMTFFAYMMGKRSVKSYVYVSDKDAEEVFGKPVSTDIH